MTYVLLICILFFSTWNLLLVKKQKQLKHRSSALDEYESSLSDARDRLEADQKTLEERYKEIAILLQKLKGKEKVSQDCRDRYKKLLPLAEEAVKVKASRDRSFEQVLLRGLIARQLKKEGYSVSEISRALKYNHSTVMFYLKKIDDALSLPAVFKPEKNIIDTFDQLVTANEN